MDVRSFIIALLTGLASANSSVYNQPKPRLQNLPVPQIICCETLETIYL